MFGRRRKARRQFYSAVTVLAAAIVAADQSSTKPARKTKMLTDDVQASTDAPKGTEAGWARSVKAPLPKVPFPSPNDRTPNEPAYLLCPQDLLRLYNSARPSLSPATNDKDLGGTLVKIDTRVIDWAIEMSKFEGWSQVRVIGNQILLIANVTLVGRD